MRTLEILPSTFTANKPVRYKIPGMSLRVKKGISGYRIKFDNEQDGFPGQYSIALRPGQVRYQHFAKFYIVPTSEIYSDNYPIVIEIFDPKELMLNMSNENIFEEDDYNFITVDLSVDRSGSPVALGYAGLSYTVFKLDGNASVILNKVTNDEILYTPIIYPDMITDKINFNEIYVRNAVQAGKNLILRIGRREV